MADRLPIAFVTTPLVLWGVALGAIPILIHLLQRRRYRETRWAAMRFLVEAARKHSRRLRIEQLILLLVRTAVLLCVVTALFGAFTAPAGEPSVGAGPLHRIIVVDASYSMQALGASGRTSFDEARSAALKAAASSKAGDLLNLVTIRGAGIAADVVATPTPPSRAFADEIGRLTATAESGSLTDALTAVQSQLNDRRAAGLQSKQVVFLTDLQRRSWFPDSTADRQAIQQAIRSISSSARITVVDVGEPVANAAVASLSISQPYALANRPIDVRATVRNFDRRKHVNRTVRLFLNRSNSPVDARSVRVEAGREAEVVFRLPDAERGLKALPEGDRVLEVRLDADRLPLDDSRWLALPVRQRLQVLLVNGNPSGRPHEDAVFYLTTALQPGDEKDRLAATIEPKTILVDGLRSVALSQYDCVFLCNVPQLDATVTQRLLRYVQRGGSLVVGLGNRVDAAAYNDVLYANGKGILPARLVRTVDGKESSRRWFGFDTSKLSHPIVARFDDNPGTGLDSVYCFRYVRTVPHPEADVALRFEPPATDRPTGDAAIVARRFGRGRCVLLTTSLDSRWGTWAAINPSFLPVMHEIVRLAAAGRWKERQTAVGSPLSVRLSQRPTETGRTLKLVPPKGEPLSLAVSDDDGFAAVTLDRANAPGPYELLVPSQQAGKLKTMAFAVNPDVDEGDLARAAAERFHTEYSSDIQVVSARDFRQADRSAAVSSDIVSPLVRRLLWLAALLVLVDAVMAYRFSWGLGLLSASLVAALAGWLLAGGHWYVAVPCILAAIVAGWYAFRLWGVRRSSP